MVLVEKKKENTCLIPQFLVYFSAVLCIFRAPMCFSVLTKNILGLLPLEKLSKCTVGKQRKGKRKKIKEKRKMWNNDWIGTIVGHDGTKQHCAFRLWKISDLGLSSRLCSLDWPQRICSYLWYKSLGIPRLTNLLLRKLLIDFIWNTPRNKWWLQFPPGLNMNKSRACFIFNSLQFI